MVEGLSRKGFLRLCGAAAGALAVPSVTAGAAGAALAGAEGWGYVGQILRNVVPPRFPRRDFVVTDFGAVGDGVSLDTGAIAAAVAACARAGGGRVVVPPGRYLTGAVRLRDNVNLHVSAGATLLFSTDPQHYLPVVLTRFEGIEVMNYSPFVYAHGCTNVAVTGGGTLDGQGGWDGWWGWVGMSGPGWAKLQQMAREGVPVAERVFGAGHYLRAAMVQTYGCQNVLIEGVRIVRSPFWCVHPVLSRNVTVQGVRIDSAGPNNDGVNPESCRYVVVRDCVFDAGDDCIAIKSGREADGLRVNVPSQDILVERCTMRTRYGAITIGSEMTGGARNVFVRDCVLGSPSLYFGLYIKTNSHRGGFAENIYLKDLQISNLTKEVISCNFYRGEGDTGPLTPRVRNIELRNIRVGHARNAFSMRGYPRSPVQDLRLVDTTFGAIDEPSTIEHVEMTFDNFRVNGDLITDPAQLL